MPQPENSPVLFQTPTFTDNFEEILVPDGKVWLILGVSLSLTPLTTGLRTVSIGYDATGGIPLVESFSPAVGVDGTKPGTRAIFCGVPGMNGAVSATTTPQPHVIIPLPPHGLLPEGSRIYARFNSNPSSPLEVKNMTLLVDEFIEVG